MQPNRWFYIRHPNGFSPKMFECFKAQCRIWRAHVEAIRDNWEYIDILSSNEKSEQGYIFFEPQLSEDGQVVKLGLGGEPSYSELLTFEDNFPEDLYKYFPIDFQLDLELGRPSSPGEKIRWWPLYSEEETEAMREMFHLDE
jgi:hypothetical protein